MADSKINLDRYSPVPELRGAVKLLHKEYERAKQNPVVRDPLAYALYQVWKAADRGARMDGDS